MAFTFGTPKTTMGVAMPTATATNSPGFTFGGASGDAKTTKPAITLTFTPAATSASIPAVAPATTGGLTFSSITSTAPQFSLGTTPSSTGSGLLPFSLSTTSTPSLLNVSAPNAPSTNAALTSIAFSLPAATTITKSTPITAPIISSVVTPSTTSNVAATTSATPVMTGLGTTNALTYSHLEDSINKWTINLDDEGKQHINQAKAINAWDRLLITNGEKILSLNKGIERVKQQQEQLDQELDFVLAQQKELEDLIAPLEKELEDIPVTDLDRHRTYQMAETLDTQLKQMSEDLKEIIEHLNESNKLQEMSNPIIQIGRILNVHMNSLQWIDRNTTKITTHLDQIAKMHDMNKRNHEINLQKTYE
ncbi:Nsp1-like C-terminal region [Popillia japonica]|uniref:Nsp1-like C-terminal region n=2 Tax=Scarabaeidae TaxID=7055 RepID=A0AAW1K103_POPJA